jgi:hypothetical protein
VSNLSIRQAQSSVWVAVDRQVTLPRGAWKLSAVGWDLSATCNGRLTIDSSGEVVVQLACSSQHTTADHVSTREKVNASENERSPTSCLFEVGFQLHALGSLAVYQRKKGLADFAMLCGTKPVVPTHLLPLTTLTL